MDESTLWWLLVGVAIIAELLTGTFYLLMLALGMAAGAIAALAGASATTQLLAASVVGGGTVLWCYFFKKRASGTTAASNNLELGLDVGEQVQVISWNADGTTQVRYRGAPWTAALAPGATPSPGAHRVVEVKGNRLLIEKI